MVSEYAMSYQLQSATFKFRKKEAFELAFGTAVQIPWG